MRSLVVTILFCCLSVELYHGLLGIFFFLLSCSGASSSSVLVSSISSALTASSKLSWSSIVESLKLVSKLLVLKFS